MASYTSFCPAIISRETVCLTARRVRVWTWIFSFSDDFSTARSASVWSPISVQACSFSKKYKMYHTEYPSGGSVGRYRCRANMAHMRQSRLDAGLGFEVQVLRMFLAVPTSLGSGAWIGRNLRGKRRSARTIKQSINQSTNTAGYEWMFGC